jgi:hypothetical protein
VEPVDGGKTQEREGVCEDALGEVGPAYYGMLMLIERINRGQEKALWCQPTKLETEKNKRVDVPRRAK